MKPLLIIDPGHGGRDPGGGSCDLFAEKDIVLKISLYQAERFRELGLPVTLTRTDDTTITAGPRAKLVRDSGARYCISNHINAATNKAARGVETIHSIHNDGKLAHQLLDAIVDAGMPKRRVFARSLPDNPKKDYYFMHRETGSVTTIIIEYGFASNADDAQLLAQRWKDYAEAAVMAFCRYIDHPYKPPAVAADDSLKTIVNGARIADGVIIDSRVYVPLRAVGDAIGADVHWDGSTRTATLTTRK